MITNADFVSRVLNDVNSLTKDDHISRRHVLKIGRQKATTFISQKLLERTLYRESNILKTLECVEMIPIDKVKCPIIEFRRCDNLYRSKHKVQGIIYSRLGSSIFNVESVDGSVSYTFATPRTVRNNKKRMFGDMVHNFYVSDDYLYIPEEIELVNITGIFLNDKETEEIATCKECDECKSVWDYNFIAPDKLLEPIVMQTVQEIASVLKQIPEDNNPNLDSYQKSQVTE